MNQQPSTIVAIATATGKGAIAMIRLSGKDSVSIVNKAWKRTALTFDKPRSVCLGTIFNPANGEDIDQVLATVFQAPASFTGEHMVEISCHASPWIQKEIVNIFVSLGAIPAGPGEFSRRAFMNGKIDLAKAEGIADIIASSSKAAHRIAFSQMKGTFSKELFRLREKLVEIASLIELELDFSEEDVEFADRNHLKSLSKSTITSLRTLANTFTLGNAIKNGVPIAILGATNAGKSTLLNKLLNEEKAIVSPIHGTTRDVIEDTVEINGTLFRFIDTAGIRPTDDPVERIGISRGQKAATRASLVLWLIDPTNNVNAQITTLSEFIAEHQNIPIRVVITKSDLCIPEVDICNKIPTEKKHIVSAITGEGIDLLINALSVDFSTDAAGSDIIISNARHNLALTLTAEALERAVTGLDNDLPTDLIAQEIREATHHLGEITGDINSDTLLHNIFSHFCIGK